MFVRNLARVARQQQTGVARSWIRSFVQLREVPTDVYGHTTPNESGVRLSLSKKPNAVYIGTIPNSAVASFRQAFEAEKEAKDDQDDREMHPSQLLDPGEFSSHQKFLDIAHKTIGEHIQNCPVFSQLAAAEQGEKSLFFHIYDLRRPPPHGRIPEVEDIVGTVRLESGKIVPNSYEPNAMYRSVTPYGIFTVSDYLNSKIVSECEKSS
ncbi:hypothetical protein AWJ20_2364 [Sugiyamaella lignohabitans]|uniref:Uncharacterized protein n=1 Tax=Sugiyamaella lignohabitans TaxID=796027 RepID=A0A161HM97_9ASCO|nr:uncharacterized protein AWJ20_2364 [Sugiyamaella lignohabitans]ANB14757.1 hypothetical protein AWJ20_2364 [Sugiyamaella lignohabitans]